VTLRGAHVEDKKQLAQVGIQEHLTRYRKKLLPLVVSQRIGEVSMFGNTQNATGLGTEQLGLTGPVLRKRLDYTVSRGSFEPTQFYGYLHGVN